MQNIELQLELERINSEILKYTNKIKELQTLVPGIQYLLCKKIEYKDNSSKGDVENNVFVLRKGTATHAVILALYHAGKCLSIPSIYSEVEKIDNSIPQATIRNTISAGVKKGVMERHNLSKQNENEYTLTPYGKEAIEKIGTNLEGYKKSLAFNADIQNTQEQTM